MKPKSSVQICVFDVCIPTVMKVSVINTSVDYNIYIFPVPSYTRRQDEVVGEAECIKSCLDVDVQILFSLNKYRYSE